jgi:serine/threonine-protein kinase
MPKEQALGLAKEIDARTDLWAAAATMFTTISGSYVHDAETVEMVMVYAATQKPRSLAAVAPNVPAEIVTVVDHALEYEKENRYPDARSMQAALVEAYEKAFGKILPGSDIPRERRSQSMPPPDPTPSSGRNLTAEPRARTGADESGPISNGRLSRTGSNPRLATGSNPKASASGSNPKLVLSGTMTKSSWGKTNEEDAPEPRARTLPTRAMAIGAAAIIVALSAVGVVKMTGRASDAADAAPARLVAPPPQVPSATATGTLAAAPAPLASASAEAPSEPPKTAPPASVRPATRGPRAAAPPPSAYTAAPAATAPPPQPTADPPRKLKIEWKE